MLRSIQIARGALLLALVATPLSAQTAATSVLSILPESKIAFDGTSTVRAFTCTVGKITGAAETNAPASTLSGAFSIDGLVHNADVVLPVANFDCRNDTMNEHMRKALKANANPTITFRMVSYDSSAPSAATIHGKLTMAGVEKPIDLQANVTTESGRIRVTGQKEIRMSEWGVKPPSLMLGAMKVRDPVVVKFDLMLSQ